MKIFWIKSRFLVWNTFSPHCLDKSYWSVRVKTVRTLFREKHYFSLVLNVAQTCDACRVGPNIRFPDLPISVWPISTGFYRIELHIGFSFVSLSGFDPPNFDQVWKSCNPDFRKPDNLAPVQPIFIACIRFLDSLASGFNGLELHTGFPKTGWSCSGSANFHRI